MTRSAHSHHSRKSAKRSASSCKALFASAEPVGKQRLALSPHLFDTPPMSNIEIAPKRDSKAESKQEVRYSFADVPDLVDTTDGGDGEVGEGDTAEKFEVKEMKQSSSFLKWFSFWKKRESPESGKGGGAPVQKRLKKTMFHWGKKKVPLKEEEASKLELSKQEESGEIGEDGAQKVDDSKQLSDQELDESVQLPAGEEEVPEEDGYTKQSVTAAEEVQKQTMDTCSLPNAPPLSRAEGGAEETSRKDPVGEEEPMTTPARVASAQGEDMTATNLSRNASAEKIVIREGRGKNRTPENAVSIEFIKLRSVYHKRFSEFKDSDFPSPEGSDTEEGKSVRHTGTRSFRFEQFGVEVAPGSQGPSPRNLENEFEMSASPSYEGDVSALNESSLTDIAVPVEVDLSIDFNTKEILDISFHDKPGSPPLPDTEQDSTAHTSGFKTPPIATPSMHPSAPEVVTHIDDVPAGEAPEALGGGPVLQRQRSSVKNLAQMFESTGNTPSSAPMKRITTPGKLAASGDVLTATPSGKGTTPREMAPAGGTPTATPIKEGMKPLAASSEDTPADTPTKGDTTPKRVASAGDTPTATPSKEDMKPLAASSEDTPADTPTKGDTTPKRVASAGDTPTKGDTTSKRVASAGDTPTATPSKGGTTLMRMASSGDTPIATPTKGGDRTQVASLGDTPTKGDTTPKWATASGDTPIATPTKGGTTLSEIAPSGDTPTTESTAPVKIASPVDTPTGLASEVPEADEGGDVLTPLKRISASSLRRASATAVNQGRIDGFPSDGEGDGTHAQIKHSVSPPSKAMLSAFVHSADSKHLNLIKFQHDLDQANLADRVAQDLLVVPPPNDEMEAEMQKHVLNGVLQPKVYLVKVSML